MPFGAQSTPSTAADQLCLVRLRHNLPLACVICAPSPRQVCPPSARAFCGSRISRIFFATAPLDFGINFNFLSYDGAITLTSAAYRAAVPTPQVLVDCVHASLLELIALD